MGIGKRQAAGGQFVELRGGDFRLWIVAGEITVSQVVGVDEKDVGFVGGCRK